MSQRRLRMRAPWGVACAAAAALLLSACGGSSSSSSSTASVPTSTPTVTDTVTVQSVTSTVTSRTKTSTSAASQPTPAASATCTPQQLGIHYHGSLGAAGTSYAEFEFVNVSSSSCTLDGFPGVSLVTSSGRVDAITNERDAGYQPRRVTVSPGGSTPFLVGIHGNAAHPCVQATHFRFIPPNDTAYEQVAFRAQVCGGSVVVSPVGYGQGG